MNRLKELIRRFARCVVPQKCLSCGVLCESALCDECAKKLLCESLCECPDCGKRLSVCECVPQILKDAGAASLKCVFFYDKHSDDISRHVLLKLKTENNSAGFEMFASIMSAALGDKSGWIVTNVPRRKSAVLVYGFDQAEQLAREIARKLGCKYRKLLVNTGNTEQKQLNMVQRIESAKNSYRILKNDLNGLHILLVDDVITSGATTAECAKLLKQSGASQVHITAIARSAELFTKNNTLKEEKERTIK